jgi:hypothetical protein
VFAAEFVLSAANQVFVAELCSQQRTSFHCRSVWPAANQFSLPKCVACSESIFAVELCGQQWISFATDFLH